MKAKTSLIVGGRVIAPGRSFKFPDGPAKDALLKRGDAEEETEPVAAPEGEAVPEGDAQELGWTPALPAADDDEDPVVKHKKANAQTHKKGGK